jgi:hypothetical protein
MFLYTQSPPSIPSPLSLYALFNKVFLSVSHARVRTVHSILSLMHKSVRFQTDCILTSKTALLRGQCHEPADELSPEANELKIIIKESSYISLSSSENEKNRLLLYIAVYSLGLLSVP